jgi:Ca-activated chloride channel family protein
MTFLAPQALLLLLLVPLFAVIYVWMQRRRRRYALRYASVALVRDAVGKGPGIRRHIPPALFLLALAAMGLAVARPQAIVPVTEDLGTVVLAVDTSGSMQATDVSPNRMEATKDAVRRFVEAEPDGVQIGIVSFSDAGAVLQAPTKDRDDVLRTIDRLRPDRGTNIGGGLAAALDAIAAAADTTRAGLAVTPSPTPVAGAAQSAEERPPASVVLVSDGESNTGPAPLDVAREAAAAGVRVYTVGIGTAQGVTLRVNGQTAFTRLDETTLRGMAELTGGRYLNAQDEAQLTEVYDELAREQQVAEREVEVTFAMAAGALLLSAVGGALSLLWFNRLP